MSSIDGKYHHLSVHYKKMRGEIILAALSSREELPTGATVVAVIHVEHDRSGLPPLEISEVVAVGADGNEVQVTVDQENGDLR